MRSSDRARDAGPQTNDIGIVPREPAIAQAAKAAWDHWTVRP